MRCGTCKNKVSKAVPGRCKNTNCANGTPYAIDKLCNGCSTSLGECSVCRQPLKGKKTK